MRKLLVPMLIASVVLLAMFGLIHAASSQGPDRSGGDQVMTSESQGDNVREIYAPGTGDAPAQPDISFIDSPSATCYQPDPSQDLCHINWYYNSVTASPNYMISMTITINALGMVANTQGFFQTSMYVPYNMLGNGFKVACGNLGAGGNAALGNAYGWTIRARDSAGLKSANYGTVYCPAYTP